MNDTSSVSRLSLIFLGMFLVVFSTSTDPMAVEEEEYYTRNVWQCKVRTKGGMDLEDPVHTHVLYSFHDLVAFATAMSFDHFQQVHALSRRDCHYFGKVKEAFGDKDDGVEIESKKGWFSKYRSFNEIKKYFQKLADNNPHFVKFVPSIGKTTQGRDIFAVHITSGSRPTSKLYIQCLIHAREWISGSVCQYIAGFLVKQFKKKKKFKKMMSNMEFVMVPVVNPDGYVRTMSDGIKYRFWRKNVGNNTGGGCHGVDLNRNFNFHWNSDKGSSGKICREDYRGPYPHSEPEVQAIVKFIKKLAPVNGAVDFHSFSQLVLYPYVYSKKPPPHVHKLTKIAKSVAKIISKVNGQVYMPMRGDKFFYPASGTFADWVYSGAVSKTNRDSRGVAHRIVPLSIELRPEGIKSKLGFVLPVKQIIPTCKEAFLGVIWFAMKVLKNHWVYIG